MTNNKDPRNVYLNPNGVPATISRYDAFLPDSEPRRNRIATPGRPTPSPAPKPVTSSRPNRVDPELEARVPAGRYAIDTPNGVRFYQVDKPATGKWVGWTFVKVQASDDVFPVRAVAQRTEILRAIAIDPAAASVRYGRELGVCGVCGRTLTDENSIARGIGPICESRF